MLSTPVCVRLQARGVAPLPPVFMFPVPGGGSRSWCWYPTRRKVRWREREQDFFLRSAAVPFDMVPLRPTDPRRRGAYFSLGPALITETSTHRLVLLVQIEGPADEAARSAEEISRLVAPSAGEVRQTAVPSPWHGWTRHCLAAPIVERAADGDSSRAGRQPHRREGARAPR